MLDIVVVSNGSAISCDDGLERMGSGVKGSDFGDELVEDFDSYWDDINDRLMISRMVSDSVIRGMVHAVEQEAAETVAAKELEVTSLKESLHFLDVGANKIELYEPENINYGQHLSLSNDYVEHDKMRESLSSLRYAAKEQFNRLKKEIDGIRGCNSIRRINSGSELVGLGGILKEKKNESWIGVDRTVDSLKMTLDTIITRVDDMLQLSKISLCEWWQEQDFQREIEAVVMQSLIRSLQEEFEEKLWEQSANFCGSQSVNWLEKFDKISSLRKELDVILKLLPNQETGQLVSLGSGDVDHSHRKVLNNHIPFSTQHQDGNGKVCESETGVLEAFDAAHNKHLHLSRVELVKHYNTMLWDSKRDHESTVDRLTEEIISLKGKILNERGSSAPNRKDKEFDILKKMIPEVILKLDGIIVDNEKLPALCDSTLGSLKDRLDSLLLENHQLRDLLTDKKNEVKCLLSQVSEAEEKMLQHSSSETNFLRLLTNLNSSLGDTSIEASVREEVYKCVLRELSDRIKSDTEESEMKSIIMQEIYGIIYGEGTRSKTTGQCEIEESEMESLIMQEMCGCIFRECIKDATGQLKELNQKYMTENERKSSLEREVLEKEKKLRLEVVGNERLKQEVALLVTLKEEKEKLAMEEKEKLMKKTVQFDLASQELSELRDHTKTQLSNTCKDLDLVKGELKEALEHIKVNEMEINSLNKHLELQMHKLEEADEQKKMAVALSQATQNDLSLLKAKEKEQRKQMEAVILFVHALSEQFTQFECKVAEDINANNSRLMYSTSQLSSLIEKAEMLTNAGLQYKQRLERRYSDLKMAEAEVDLLGDEVETLLSLLEKIYIALDHYSPILQHYPGIIEILKLVRRELSGETCKSV